MRKLFTLDTLSLALLLLGACAVSQAPAFKSRLNPGATLTITLPEYIESALEPSVELDDNGKISPQFEAWAIGKLQGNNK